MSPEPGVATRDSNSATKVRGSSMLRTSTQLGCQVFQVRFIGAQEQFLLKPFGLVWSDLQMRFTPGVATSPNDYWFG